LPSAPEQLTIEISKIDDNTLRHCELPVSGVRNCIQAMNHKFVIARSTSDAAIHEYRSAPRWIATAFGLAMTGFFGPRNDDTVAPGDVVHSGKINSSSFQ
jgi:hypothetical protein